MIDQAAIERMLLSAANDLAADFGTKTIAPENDLHPDPARLQQDLFSLRHRVSDLEQRISALEARRNHDDRSTSNIGR